MEKDLFKTRQLSLAALCGFMLTLASCANEDITKKKTDTDNNDKNLTTFVTGTEPESRTSMDYNSGAFFWEADDYIYVKDDNNVWQRSSNAPTTKTAYFKFKVPGKFAAKTSYKVYYPGKNDNNDQVTISAAQAQTEPNTTTHLGESGDCGTADATRATGKNQFEFKLDHQAAYLVFQPYTSNTVLKKCYLTKIEVNSNNDITDTYTLDPTTGELTGTGTGKKITLFTSGSGAYTNGFPLTNSSASVATNGAYMVIKPGIHTLKVRYWVKDIVTNVEGTITKLLNSFNYVKNTYYDMTADLKVKDYDGDHYYQWDAQQQYWYGYEWTKNLPAGQGQPTLAGNSGSNYAQNNSDPRYYNDSFLGLGVKNEAQTALFQSLPNVNELSWYIMKGNPCWDADELWSTMGHLYKGGIWLLKKAEISGFRSDKAYNNIDFYGSTTAVAINTPSLTPPSATDASKYFFLPALGHYGSGKLYGIGEAGEYHSSSSYPFGSTISYALWFTNYDIRTGYSMREYGQRVQALE